MRKKQTTLGDVYGEMLKSVKTVVNENAQENINKSKKIPKMSKNAFNDKMGIQKGGPIEADGFHKALNDDYCGCDEEDNEEKQYDRISEIEEKLKNPNLSDKEKASLEKTLKNMKKDMQREEAEENIVKESKKIARERLNTFMMKKSTFDKLFESVMGGSEDAENAALGLSDAPTDDEFGDDMGDEDMGDEDMGDEVTFTLDRATAQKLHDVLMGVLGGEEDFGDEGDDLDFDVEGDEMDEEGDMYDDEEEYDEDEQNFYPTDEVGNDGTIGAKNSKDGSHKLQSKNNKVGGRPQPKNQGTKVTGTTDKVGNDGDYGHALHGAKQPNYGKQNKVSDLRQSEDFFR
jgi:hypothetical protein